MDDLTRNVEMWAKDKQLDKAQPEKQFLKVAEELGEVGAGMARGNLEAVKDGIGDTIVTLIILAMQHGFDTRALLNRWKDVELKRDAMLFVTSKETF